MFNKKEAEDSKRNMPSSASGPSSTKLQTVVGDGTRIQGEVKVNGDLRIDGEVEGMLSVTSSVVVGKSGVVKADVDTGTAEIAGRVVGKIIASDRVVLLGGSRLEGDVQAQSLKIEDGAFFQGNCIMGERKQSLSKASSDGKSDGPRLALAEGQKG